MAFVNSTLKTLGFLIRKARTVMPGKLGEVEASGRDQTATLEVGVGELDAGKVGVVGPIPDLPVLTFAGGGFYILLPAAQGDETLALVSDRETGTWRRDREPGKVNPIQGKRSHNTSDALLAPLAITAPPGAPDTWDGLQLGGPKGVAVSVAADGSVTLTALGAVTSTVTMDAAGSVTIGVEPGQSVNVGGPAALSLAKSAPLNTAFVAAMNAGINLPGVVGDPLGTNASLALAAALTAWQLAYPATVPTTKAKGE